MQGRGLLLGITKKWVDNKAVFMYDCISTIVQLKKRSGEVDWIIDKSRPICPQIGEQLCLRIAQGMFAPHQKLPSVREIAVSAGVNPNTVQHSLEELERKGVLYSVPSSGWYVAENTALAGQVLQGILEQKTADYFAAMSVLGMDAAAVKNYVKEWSK